MQSDYNHLYRVGMPQVVSWLVSSWPKLPDIEALATAAASAASMEIFVHHCGASGTIGDGYQSDDQRMAVWCGAARNIIRHNWRSYVRERKAIELYAKAMQCTPEVRAAGSCESLTAFEDLDRLKLIMKECDSMEWQILQFYLHGVSRSLAAKLVGLPESTYFARQARVLVKVSKLLQTRDVA